MRMAIVFLLLACALLSQSTYYVNYSTGNDSNPGTEALPWKNASKIGSGSGANDTVKLAGGVTLQCDTAIVLDSGQTLTSYGNGIAIVNGDDGDDVNDDFHCVQLDTTTGVTVENVSLHNRLTGGATQPVNSGIHASGSLNNVTIRRVTFLGGFTGFNCNSIGGTGNVIVGCFFERPWTDGIDVRGTLDLVINNCTFWRCGVDGNAAAVGGAGDAISSHDSGTFTATDCRFFSGARGPGVSIHTTGTCTFDRCFVTVDDETGASGRYVFGIDCSGAGSGVMNVTNCVIIDTGTVEHYVFRARNGGDMNLYNNTILVTNTHATTTVFLATGGSGTLMTAKGNIVVSTDTDTRFASDVVAGGLITDLNCYYPTAANRWLKGGVVKDFATWQSEGYDVDGLVADPLVANSATPSYVTDARLMPSSPCANAMPDPLVTVDIRNRTRITNDIGAWSKER